MAVVALTIGLSVGLTRNKGSNSPTNSAATGSTTTSTGSTTTGTSSTTAPMDSTSTNTTSTTTSTSSTTTESSSETKTYTTSVGSMEATIKLFNPNITIPYSDHDELKADLTEAAKLLVINIIKLNKEQQFSGYGYYYGGNYNGTGEYYYDGNYNGTGGYYYDGYYNGTDGFYYDGNGTMGHVTSEGGFVGPANSTTTSAGGDKAQFATEGSSDVPVLRYVSHGYG